MLVVSHTFLDRGEADDGPVINVPNITDDRATSEKLSSIKYRDDRHSLRFQHMGVYKGHNFMQEVIFRTQDNQTFTLIRTMPDIKASDGVPEAYMVPRFENDELIVNIFIDDDFRDHLEDDVNIIWGSEYQNFREYSFDEVFEPGIYVDTVHDNDTDRFIYGGNDANVFVGDATQENARNKNLDGITGVFLK